MVITILLTYYCLWERLEILCQCVYTQVQNEKGVLIKLKRLLTQSTEVLISLIISLRGNSVKEETSKQDDAHLEEANLLTRE